MFMCTFSEEKKDELINKGFKLVCKQHQGEVCLYTFELKPTLYALFSEDERKDIFLSNKMVMA